MPKKKYIVTLSDAEREELEQRLRSGKHSSRKVTRAPVPRKKSDLQRLEDFLLCAKLHESAKFDFEETFANVLSDLSEYGTCQSVRTRQAT